MWKCPICSIEEKSEYICQNCGYDVRKDFVRNRTIQPVPPQDAKTFAKWISNHDEAQRQKADEAIRVLLDVIKREQEKKAEDERRAEEERKAREAEAARKVEEERKTREAEAARKAEEERKAREAEAARKAEEERKMREAEAARKAEEESRARAAEAARRSAERARKEAEERQKVHQTYTEKKQKKSSKGLKLAAKFILFSAVFGVIGAVTGSMNDDEGMYSSNSNEEAYSSYNSGTSYNTYRPEFDSVEEEWGYVVQTIKDSLQMDGIDYRTDSLDAISDFWRSCGYDVEVNPMTYDEENGYESGNVSGNDGYAYFCCHDIKDADSLGRYLTFSSHTKEYDSLNCIAPLAFGIQFGDSYQVVCEKLGITEEMVFYLSEAEIANDVSIILDEPGGESVSITVNFDDCYFSYFFDEQTYEFRTLFVDGYTYNEEPYDMENDIDVTENLAHGWDDIVQTSIDALQYGHIDYIGDSHEDIVNMLETDGFEQDYRNTTIEYKSKRFSLGKNRYTIGIQDGYQLINHESRSLHFVCYPEYGEDPDGTLKPVFLNDVPLPYGITFEDSFDTVCKKLGITEDMIFEAENMDNLYVTVETPDKDQLNAAYAIFIDYTRTLGEYYDFTYVFSDDGSYLTDYLVTISY